MTHRTGAATRSHGGAPFPASPRAASIHSPPREPRSAPAQHIASLAEPQSETLVSRTNLMALENLAGRSIAGYRLLERIGEGGTAEVYRAEHPERGACAFKVLRERLRGDPIVVKRFLRQAGYGSRAVQPPEERLTKTGFFVGTLQYVAPEALSGELVDGRADIYSLAKITYYMLSGRHPHDGRSPRELFQQLLSGRATPLSEVTDRKFPPGLEAAVMKGLSRNPGDRQPTMSAFAADLEAAVARAKDAGKPGGLLGALKNIVGKRNSE